MRLESLHTGVGGTWGSFWGGAYMEIARAGGAKGVV